VLDKEPKAVISTMIDLLTEPEPGSRKEDWVVEDG
jgi:hypothetical protein